MTAARFFPRDYEDGRRRFLEACAACGVRVDSFECPQSGPDGQPLFADVGVIGPAAAQRVLLVTTGVHGVEGLCGSGVLAGWLADEGAGAALAEVRRVYVHALNPFGFAWLRRVNEDNVDLNRNFVTHGAGYPENPGYEHFHPLILPQRLDDQAATAFWAAVAAYRAAHGEAATLDAVSGGQYSRAEGLFYGGRAEVWSNRTLRALVARHVGDARRVAFLDVHTGLGPYGTASLMFHAPSGSTLEARLAAWYGPGLVNVRVADTAAAANMAGVIEGAVRAALPNAEITELCFEVGTFPQAEVLQAVIADNWLHLRGDPASPQGRAIKAAMRQAFYPDDDDWKELVLVRARQILRRALRGLTAD